MKLVVLHDDKGVILAAAHVSEGEPYPVPVARENTRVTTVEVPQAHRRLDLEAICTRLRLNPKTNELVEHPSRS